MERVIYSTLAGKDLLATLGVAALPEMLPQLTDASSPRFPAGQFDRYKGLLLQFTISWYRAYTKHNEAAAF